MQVRDVHTETPVFKGKYLLLFNGIYHQILTGESNSRGHWFIARSRIKRRTKDKNVIIPRNVLPGSRLPLAWMYVSKTQERKGELVFPRISCLGAWVNKADKSDRTRERKRMVAGIVPPIRSQRQEQDQQRFYNMYILFYSLFLKKKITSQYWIF